MLQNNPTTTTAPQLNLRNFFGWIYEFHSNLPMFGWPGRKAKRFFLEMNLCISSNFTYIYEMHRLIYSVPCLTQFFVSRRVGVGDFSPQSTKHVCVRLFHLQLFLFGWPRRKVPYSHSSGDKKWVKQGTSEKLHGTYNVQTLGGVILPGIHVTTYCWHLRVGNFEPLHWEKFLC